MGFTVADVNENDVTLSSKFGKPIVLNFWASWCSPCKSEMPEFENLYKEYSDNVEFIMVNLTDGERETISTAKSFIESMDYTFPVYFDVNQDSAYTYEIYSIPTTYFIDSEGKIAAYSQGVLDEATIRKGIGMIYSE